MKLLRALPVLIAACGAAAPATSPTPSPTPSPDEPVAPATGAVESPLVGVWTSFDNGVPERLELNADGRFVMRIEHEAGPCEIRGPYELTPSDAEPDGVTLVNEHNDCSADYVGERIDYAATLDGGALTLEGEGNATTYEREE